MTAKPDTVDHQPVIAFCIEELSIGGAEHMLVVMANEFCNRNWQVHMICLTKAGELAGLLAEPVKLHVLNKKPGIDPLLPFRLIRCITDIQPDVINSHLWVANAWTRLSLLLNSTPVVATEHSRDIWKPLHYRVIDRVLSRRSFRLIAVSEDTAEFYRSVIAIKDHRITVIPNGVDTHRFAQGCGVELRQSLLNSSDSDTHDSSILIGTVGRLVPAKNHLRLLDALAILCADEALADMDLRLWIVGEGSERDSIQQYIEQLKLTGNVTLTGARHDIPDVLSAFDIFVLSSDREGHPLTSLEAQAAGTPVVLTDAGGSGETIACEGEQVGGVLVQRDAKALADAIRQMIVDPELRRSRAEFARKYAPSHFDKRQMIDRYAQIFIEATQSR